VRALLAEYDGFIRGGIYSIETTYNRLEKTWHIHAHVLADCCASLPHWSQKLDLGGRLDFAFVMIKKRMEFDWLLMWQADGYKGVRRYKDKAYRKITDLDVLAQKRADDKRKWQERADGDHFMFEQWVRAGIDHEIRKRVWSRQEKRYVKVPIAELSPKEIERRTKWNARNRRMVDIRRVNDREGAAREVLKYITKGAAFSDLPDAVEEFCDAVRGARLVQTFGTWYGFDAEADFDTEHLDDWGEPLQCACGLNHWERAGVFYRRDVAMDAAGRWFVKSSLGHSSRGTVPRPTIRALEAPEEQDGALCQWETR